jgi:hypothetical protein
MFQALFGYISIITFGLLCIACSSSQNKPKGDFKTPSEKTEELSNQHVFGNKALEWRMFQSEPVTEKGEKNILWTSATQIMRSYPILLNHFQTGLIQTDWFTEADQPNKRLRLVIKVLSSEIKAENVVVIATCEEKQNDKWIKIDNNQTLETQIQETILNNALALEKSQKKD